MDIQTIPNDFMVVLTPYVVVLLCIGIVGCLVSLFAWRKRDAVGGQSVAIFLVLSAAGNVAFALEIGSVDAGVKFFWFRLEVVLQLATTVAWVILAFVYAGRDELVSRWSVAGLSIVPALIAVSVWTPATRYFVAGARPAAVGAYPSFDVSFGPLFIAWIVFITLCSLVTSGLYLRLYLQAKHLSRFESLTVLAAALVPWTDAVFAQFHLPVDVSLTAPLMSVSGILLTIGLYGFKPLDPVPAAQDAILEKMGAGVIVLDDEDRIRAVNPAARETLSGKTETAALLGDAVTAHFPEWSRIEGQVEPGSWEQVSLVVDGESRHFETQVVPFFNYRDDLVGQFVLLHDVTERERRERDYARFKHIFESVRDRVYVLDEDGRISIVNEPFAELVGYDRDELIGRPFSELVAPGSDADSLVASDAEAISGDRESELVIETRTGEEIPCETSLTPIEFEFGELRGGSVGVVRDISRRKRLESDLAETVERYETMTAASPLAIMTLDTALRVERWNPAAEQMFGWPAADVDGQRLPMVTESTRAGLESMLETVLDGARQVDYEATLERADGSCLDTSCSAAPIRDGGGEIRACVLFIVDITERKQRERELERTNEQLEQFASVVSHDLRNPLSVAQGRLELLEDDSEHVDWIARSHDRMEAIIEDVLTLARQGQSIGETESVSLESLAGRAWAYIDTPEATLVVENDRSIEADPDRLLQLFENLFRNAIDHGGDEVTVTVSVEEDGFSVADDGPGIPEEQRETVLESGYTTADEGTGFGLAIVAQVAEAHGWTIEVTESENGGAQFTVQGLTQLAVSSDD